MASGDNQGRRSCTELLVVLLGPGGLVGLVAVLAANHVWPFGSAGNAPKPDTPTEQAGETGTPTAAASPPVLPVAATTPPVAETTAPPDDSGQVVQIADQGRIQVTNGCDDQLEFKISYIADHHWVHTQQGQSYFVAPHDRTFLARNDETIYPDNGTVLYWARAGALLWEGPSVVNDVRMTETTLNRNSQGNYNIWFCRDE